MGSDLERQVLWRGIVDEFDRKWGLAKSLVQNHPRDLGLAREAILRDLIRDHLPRGNYKVGQGFIRNSRIGRTSKQCDILGYEESVSPPLFSAGDVLVVEATAARLIVEVKSNLNGAEFRKADDLLQDVRRTSSPGRPATMIFAGKGCTIDWLCGEAAEFLKQPHTPCFPHLRRIDMWPRVVAVMDRRYCAMPQNMSGKNPEVGAHVLVAELPDGSEGALVATFVLQCRQSLIQANDPDIAKYNLQIPSFERVVLRRIFEDGRIERVAPPGGRAPQTHDERGHNA